MTMTSNPRTANPNGSSPPDTPLPVSSGPPTLVDALASQVPSGDPDLSIGRAIMLLFARRDQEPDREDWLRAQAAILAEVRDAIVVTDPAGRITYWNDGAARLFGYRANEMIGSTPAVLDPSHHAGRPPDPGSAPALGSVFDGDWLARRKDGSSVWIRLFARPILDSAGAIVGGIGIATDVSERKRAELAHQGFAQAIEQATHAVVMTDADARITYVNPAFEQLSGFQLPELLGEHPRILDTDLHAPGVHHAVWAELARGVPWKGMLVDGRRDGSRYAGEAVVSVVRDTAGLVSGYLVVISAPGPGQPS